jgi:hypothetical protein
MSTGKKSIEFMGNQTKTVAPRPKTCCGRHDEDALGLVVDEADQQFYEQLALPARPR